MLKQVTARAACAMRSGDSQRNRLIRQECDRSQCEAGNCRSGKDAWPPQKKKGVQQVLRSLLHHLSAPGNQSIAAVLTACGFRCCSGLGAASVFRKAMTFCCFEGESMKNFTVESADSPP